MMEYNVAVGGATGNVGTTILRILEERSFPVRRLTPLASARTAGRTIQFAGRPHEVGDLSKHDLSEEHFLFLSTGRDNARLVAPRAASEGCIVIDNSSAFRMNPDVPLVVPEVNSEALSDWSRRRILPVANCSTIQLVVALKPLHDAAGLRRVTLSSYQSVSGGGKQLVETLDQQLRDDVGPNSASASPVPISLNVIPQIDTFLPDGRTKEEWKMEVESRRILAIPDLLVSATCVRVPVVVGHALAVQAVFDRQISADDARALLSNAPGVRLLDDPSNASFATPRSIAGTDAVWVSRIRRDSSVENGLLLWIVADNVRKGAALNAVQLAEEMISSGRLTGDVGTPPGF